MSEPLRIGVAGLGTVGVGVVSLLNENSLIVSGRAGRQIQIVASSARDKYKFRGVKVLDATWYDDAVQMAHDPMVQVVVEMIGGSDGTAQELVETALTNGKHVVTANKALIAESGMELAKIAEERGSTLWYEAAVGGCIPVISALRDGVSSNRFIRIAGILNGTSNFILSKMEKEGRGFDEVLKEAQDLGYAEADPTLDVEGMDTAHKLAIISTLANGSPLNIDGVYVEGIKGVTRRDMKNAEELGYRIRLVGFTERTSDGLLQRVHPTLVPKASSMGRIDGAFNAVDIDGSASGRVLLQGQGAGGGPTASAIVSDLIQIARGARPAPFTIPVSGMRRLDPVPITDLQSCYYLRLKVEDQPGVLSDITSIFAKEEISVRALIQHDSEEDAKPKDQPAAAQTPQTLQGEEKGPEEKRFAQVVITTHKTKESAMMNAIAQIDALESVVEPTHKIRIEDL